MATGDYCSLNDIKVEAKITTTTDDAMLTQMITDASREIDLYCGGRTFYGRVETRYYDALDDTDFERLYLDDDLTGVISITLGDSTTVAASEYVLEPLNRNPKHAIRMKTSSTKTWGQYSVDPQAAIAVAGTWGYVSGTVPPEVIRRACIKYVRWMYLARRTNPQSETAGIGGTGEIRVSTSLPNDIIRMLNPYRKTAIGAV